MNACNMNEVAEYFNTIWPQYKEYVAQNGLCHRELLAALDQFLHDNLAARPFIFVDVGCGDGSVIVNTLLNHSIKKYIGIDIAQDVLHRAPLTLAPLNCEKEFIFDNMTEAIKQIHDPVDVIFSSYAVHHLSYQEKLNFIQGCKSKLVPGGFFVMIDGVLDENQTRDEWLQAYEDYFRETYPHLTEDELADSLRHTRTSDYPESVSTFASMAQRLGWRDFRVLLKMGVPTFMVFSH